jgi:hypothetical protein
MKIAIVVPYNRSITKPLHTRLQLLVGAPLGGASGDVLDWSARNFPEPLLH